MEKPAETYQIHEKVYEIIKPKRLREGMVLKHGDTYARLGPKDAVLEEQVHTESLFRRGFPVPRILESAAHGDNEWYFVEESVGDETFHNQFMRETQETGGVNDATYAGYLDLVGKYLDAQTQKGNRTNVKASDFVAALLDENAVLGNYCYFENPAEPYQAAIEKAIQRLASADMGILQFDLNPYNILQKGVIDFELVGYGPIGYDVLMSARWGGSWFTNYPSRFPRAYSLSSDQIAASDTLVRDKSLSAGLSDPSQFLEEFLLLKTAWGVLEFDVPQPSWPQDKIAFRRFRSNLLNRAVSCYLNEEPIDYWNFSNIPGGEIES